MTKYHDKCGPYTLSGVKFVVLENTGTNHLEVYRSADSGVTWQNVDAGNGPETLQNTSTPLPLQGFADAKSFAVDQIDAQLYVVYIGTDKHIHLAIFDMPTQAWTMVGTDTGGPEMADFYPDAAPGPGTTTQTWLLGGTGAQSVFVVDVLPISKPSVSVNGGSDWLTDSDYTWDGEHTITLNTPVDNCTVEITSSYVADSAYSSTYRQFDMCAVPAGLMIGGIYVAYPAWVDGAAVTKIIQYAYGAWELAAKTIPTQSHLSGMVCGGDGYVHLFKQNGAGLLHTWYAGGVTESELVPGTDSTSIAGRPSRIGNVIYLPFTNTDGSGGMSIHLAQRAAWGAVSAWTVSLVYASSTEKVSPQIANAGPQSVVFEYSAAGEDGLLAVRDTPYFDWNRPIINYSSSDFPVEAGTLVMWWMLASAPAGAVAGETDQTLVDAPDGPNYNCLFYSIYNPNTGTWGPPQFTGGPVGIQYFDSARDRRGPRLSVQVN